MERWKDVKGYENLYQVSTYGNVRNKKGKLLKFKENEKGYLRVGLSKNNKSKQHRVHRLVAINFIENSTKEVNHIDENKKNNKVENLEFCTRKENILHSIKSGKIKITRVAQYDKDMNLIKKFNSASEAEKETGIHRTHICKCALKRRGFKSAGGFIWLKI